MRLELDLDESHQLFTAVVDSLLADIKLSKDDSATLKRWRSQGMRPASDAMKELAAKINGDIERALGNKAKSAVVKPDWR